MLRGAGLRTEAEANRRPNLVRPILWLEHPVSVEISLRAGVGFPHLVRCLELRHLLPLDWKYWTDM
jgi:hypothetical protein